MGSEGLPVLIFVAVGILVVVGLIFCVIAERKRREAFLMLAAEMGLNYSAAKDRNLAFSYSFLNKLAKGENRYAFNVLSGIYRNARVLVFDYHYETHSSDAKGNQQTQNHYFSAFLLSVDRLFPELTIAREGFFSKIAQAFGYDDIDFESHEFSRKFCVRSKDKKFAYDICHPRTMEFLLANDDLNIEIDRHVVAFLFDRRLKIDQIRPNLHRLLAFRSLIPDYVLNSP